MDSLLKPGAVIRADCNYGQAVDIVLEELEKGAALHDAVQTAKDYQDARESVANGIY